MTSLRSRVSVWAPWLMVLAAALLWFALPSVSFAQTTPNPLEDQQDSALELLQTLQFWMWVCMGIGVISFMAAFGLQGVFPEFFSRFRGQIFTFAMIMVIGPGILQYILTQATSAQGGGS